MKVNFRNIFAIGMEKAPICMEKLEDAKGQKENYDWKKDIKDFVIFPRKLIIYAQSEKIYINFSQFNQNDLNQKSLFQGKTFEENIKNFQKPIDLMINDNEKINKKNLKLNFDFLKLFCLMFPKDFQRHFDDNNFFRILSNLDSIETEIKTILSAGNKILKFSNLLNNFRLLHNLFVLILKIQEKENINNFIILPEQLQEIGNSFRINFIDYNLYYPIDPNDSDIITRINQELNLPMENNKLESNILIFQKYIKENYYPQINSELDKQLNKDIENKIQEFKEALKLWESSDDFKKIIGILKSLKNNIMTLNNILLSDNQKKIEIEIKFPALFDIINSFKEMQKLYEDREIRKGNFHLDVIQKQAKKYEIEIENANANENENCFNDLDFKNFLNDFKQKKIDFYQNLNINIYQNLKQLGIDPQNEKNKTDKNYLILNANLNLLFKITLFFGPKWFYEINQIFENIKISIITIAKKNDENGLDIKYDDKTIKNSLKNLYYLQELFQVIEKIYNKKKIEFKAYQKSKKQEKKQQKNKQKKNEEENYEENSEDENYEDSEEEKEEKEENSEEKNEEDSEDENSEDEDENSEDDEENDEENDEEEKEEKDENNEDEKEEKDENNEDEKEEENNEEEKIK